MDIAKQLIYHVEGLLPKGLFRLVYFEIEHKANKGEERLRRQICFESNLFVGLSIKNHCKRTIQEELQGCRNGKIQSNVASRPQEILGAVSGHNTDTVYSYKVLYKE